MFYKIEQLNVNQKKNQSKIFSTFLSKITKYNRVPVGFDPLVARLLGHDPTPRPTCPVNVNQKLPTSRLLCKDASHTHIYIYIYIYIIVG